MSEKRYYWLKLPRDFFKRHDIKFIKTLPNGREIAFFYIELLAESVDHEGELRFSPELPYSEAMLAALTDTPVEIVEDSMKVLKELGLVKLSEDGTIILDKVKSMIGFETKWAEKKRAWRDQQRRLKNSEEADEGQYEDNVLDVSSPCPSGVLTLSDKSKSKSKSKSIKENIQEKSSRFIPPTLEEIRAYCFERNNSVDPERFFDFYSSKDWMIGKNKMKDWRAAVRTWEHENPKKQNQRPVQTGNQFFDLLNQEASS